MLGAESCGAMQLRGRISVIPLGQDSPGLIVIARSPPGCAVRGCQGNAADKAAMTNERFALASSMHPLVWCSYNLGDGRGSSSSPLRTLGSDQRPHRQILCLIEKSPDHRNTFL